MIFRKNVKKVGGYISDLKNFVANFVRFGPVCGKNHIFSRKRDGGGAGGQRPFGNFPEIHNFLKREAFLNIASHWSFPLWPGPCSITRTAL